MMGVWLYVCSKHVIFKAIEVTSEHHVWASILAGAQDTPRPRVMQIRKRLPPSPHAKSLLQEWGLPWHSETLEDEGDKVAKVKTILFPALHACQKNYHDIPREDLKTEALGLNCSRREISDLRFGVQHMVLGNSHAGGCPVSCMQNAHMHVEIFMYMNLNPHAPRCVLIKTQSIYPNHSPGVLGILCGKFTLTCGLLLRSAGNCTNCTKNVVTRSGRGGLDHTCSLQINRQRMQPCTLKATGTGSWEKSVCD
jgi:hypothetical protein